MPKFVQMQAVTVRIVDQHGKALDELELFALGDDGKVYRITVGHAGGWHVVE